RTSRPSSPRRPSGPTRAEPRSSAVRSSSCARSYRPPTGSAVGRARRRTRATGRARPSPAAFGRRLRGSQASIRLSVSISRTQSAPGSSARTSPSGPRTGTADGMSPMSPDASPPPAPPTALREEIERAAAELFVGRERELAQLEVALGEATAGRGGLCLIAGEPGIGKARLAECVATSAAGRGATVVWGRCWEGEGAPAFWPWVQVMRVLVRQDDVGTLADWLGPGAPYVAQVVPEVRKLLPDLPAAPSLDSEQARFRLYDAVGTFLTSAAAAQPLVLVLDDLHWADASSLLLLQFVVRELAEARLLLLGTYRDVEISRGHPLGDVLPRLRRERTVDRLLLRGLPDAEVHAML